MAPWMVRMARAAGMALSLHLMAPAALQASEDPGPQVARSWQPVGPALDDSYLARSPAVATDSQQRPVVAYVRTVTNPSDGRQVANIFVKRWDGAAWVPLGATALNVQRRFAAELPAIKVDEMDRPVVAWYESRTETGGRYVVYAKRWNGTAWELLGGPVNTDLNTNALSHSLALGPDQQPVVSLAESTAAGLAVRVRRWDGAQWQPVGGAGDIGTGASTQVAVDAAGRIAVAFVTEPAFDVRYVVVKRWDGTAWQALGGALTRVATNSVAPTLAAAPGGTLHVAWQEQAAGDPSKIYVSRWTDAAGAWKPVGGALDGGLASRTVVTPKIALLKTGQPVVAWTDAFTMNLHVQAWVGKQWQFVGASPVVAAQQRGYSVAVDGLGQPLLAYAQSRAIFDGDVSVARFAR